jgi:polysaccharide export outer membrane protein
MSLKKLRSVFYFVALVSLFACNYNSSRMLRTEKDYSFDEPPQNDSTAYIISVSDIIEFQLYTNDGTSLIDLTAISENQRSAGLKTNTKYLVEFDGFVKLPIIGRKKLRGMTIGDAEEFLEKEYTKYYIKPFAKIKITNRRVTVFTGVGQAKVIPLENENTTLMEVLGSAGGLTKLSKARNIKLIRGDLKNPTVYYFDLSTLEGIKRTDFVLQTHDIIYVESRSDAFREIIRDVAPVISLITSTITLIVVINNLSK